MGELTVIAFTATAFPEFRAHSTRIMEPSGISSPGLLTRMRKRALRPIMAPAPIAFPHLKFVHTEMIGGVGIGIVILDVVVRQEFGENGIVHFGGVDVDVGGGAAAEELPRRDVDFSEGFLG